MENCVLCADTALARKYFFNDMPLCNMHYAEYLEFLLDEMKRSVTSESASSAFRKYKLTLEPRPLTAQERAEKVKKEQEKRKEEEVKKEEEWEKAAARLAPSPYRMRR